MPAAVINFTKSRLDTRGLLLVESPRLSSITCPETKKQAIEEEIQLWGEAYDRSYLIQNVVFYPYCHKVSHFKDWGSDNKENENVILLY
jgi:hypothetical protein